jgi:hypothetical protein
MDLTVTLLDIKCGTNGASHLRTVERRETACYVRCIRNFCDSWAQMRAEIKQRPISAKQEIQNPLVN